MPLSGPSPAADRGVALLRAVGLARATHRCLAVHGHVDDLLPTLGGSALRLPETLAIDASRNRIMTVVASEARGAATRMRQFRRHRRRSCLMQAGGRGDGAGYASAVSPSRPCAG